jgi:uncharacterized protein (TIGR00251 family)
MAKTHHQTPPPAVALPPYLREQAGGTLLLAKVQPRASRDEVGEVLGAELKIKVTAPPVDAAANEAVLRLLAETLDCPRGAVSLVRGQTSRHKSFMIQGMSAAAVLSRLTKDGS